MKLDEIIKIPSQDHGIKDLTIFDEVVRFKHASVEKYPLLFKQDGDQYFFSIEIDNVKVAFLIAEKLSDFTDKETIMILRTYVVPEFRNKGLMTALYNTLRNQRFRIVSDLHLTPESMSVWKKLISGLGAEIIDKKTRKTRKAKLQDLSIDDASKLLMLECSSLEKPFLNNDIIEEQKIFIKI
jgi:predicted GNAT family acetyltransferase